MTNITLKHVMKIDDFDRKGKLPSSFSRRNQPFLCLITNGIQIENMMVDGRSLKICCDGWHWIHYSAENESRSIFIGVDCVEIASYITKHICNTEFCNLRMIRKATGYIHYQT